MSGRQTRKADNVREVLGDVADALAAEAALATKAAEIRGESDKLDLALFNKLYPLVREPIPAGFVVDIGVTEGKPYESRGIRSVQVQIDRMDAVFTPVWWRWSEEWIDPEGKLCEVTVEIGSPDRVLVRRSARGGVNRGNTVGNLFKGSFTNAAKLAFARIGVGHEIYIGASDFDPDVDEAAAKEQAKASAPSPQKASGDQVADLIERYQALDLSDKQRDDFKLLLGEWGIPTSSLNRAFAALTPAQVGEVEQWIERAADAIRARKVIAE